MSHAPRSSPAPDESRTGVPRRRGNRARLFALMEQLPAGVLIVDCESREILLANRRSREILFPDGAGSPETRIEGRKVPDAVDRVLDRVIENDEDLLDHRLSFRQGAQSLELLVGAVKVPAGEGRAEECVVTLIEIERLLSHAHDIEGHARETQVAFLADVSHELRTPLNAIAGYAALLLEDMPDPLTGGQRQHVLRIEECASQIEGIVEQILTMTQLAEGRASLAEQEVDPRHPLYLTATLMAPEASRRGLALNVELPDETRPIVTDPGRLRQVLVNLVQNAVKYTTEGEVALAMHQSPRGDVTYEVRDTGVGIAPEHLDRIFDRFWQARPPEGPTTAEGAGIGLSVARSLVELLQGSIEVESELGRGSTFRVTLPSTLEVRH